MCGDDRWKLFVNPADGWWTCFSGTHNQTGRVEVPLSYDTRQVQLLEMLEVQPIQYTWGETELPLWEPLSVAAKEYLNARNVSPSEVKKYGLVEWVDHHRVLVPYFNPSGTLIFWTSRRYSTIAGHGPKYLAEPGTKPLYLLPSSLMDRLVLVEGVFDAWAVRRAGFAAVALHGKSLSDNLIKMFLTFAADYGIIDVMLDTDAFSSMFKIRNKLLTYRTVNIKPYRPGKDPAEMTPNEVKGVLKCE